MKWSYSTDLSDEGRACLRIHVPANTAMVPHVWGSGIGLAASLQLIATLPPAPLSLHAEEPIVEYDRSSHPFREDLIGGAICTVEGKVPVPHGPGIGVEVDRAVLEHYGKPFR